MSTFIRTTSIYSITPSSYISNGDFVKLACKQGAKVVFLEYSPSLRISRQTVNSLQFEYYDNTGRKLAATFNRPPLMKIPPHIASIFVSVESLLVGAWSSNQKPVGLEALTIISNTLGIPLPTGVVAQTRQGLATLILKQAETAFSPGGSGKICFFYDNAQGHVTKTGLPGVGLCALKENAIQRIPAAKVTKPEVLAWFWLEYLLQNEKVTSEDVDGMIKDALAGNDAWLAAALKTIKG